MKYKITYYEEDKVVKKEIEANIFIPLICNSGYLFATFGNVKDSENRSHAFSNVISVEELDQEDDQ